GGGGPKYRFHGLIDEVRVYKRVLTPLEMSALADATPIGTIAALPENQRSAAQAFKIREAFLDQAAPANVHAALTEVQARQDRRDAFYQDLPTVMVMEEMAPPRQTHILIRGMYDKPGEAVTPGPPAILTASAVSPPNRLGLARWLVDKSNPVLARVTVNRFWQMYFGV